MIRRRRNGKFPTTSGTSGSDTDALQTDVMRFMSILGLCLMAVFALVQSIPVQETSRLRQEPAQQTLQRNIELQQARARALQSDLNQLTASIARSQERRDRTQEALASAREQLAEVIEQARQARSERERLAAELEVLGRQLGRVRQDLAGMQQAAGEKAHTLDELRERLGAEQEKLDSISQRITALKQQPARTPAPSVTEQRPPPAATAGKREFTLRFASASALDQLVAAGRVSLYAMADQRAWRVSLTGGAPAFASAAYPGWFHEMAPDTVPAHYGQSLKKAAADIGRSALVWGVQLPPATRADIASLTGGQQGGTLVIRADGKVTLARE